MKQHEIRRVVISPGSRHYPFIRSLESDPFFELFSVVDERSAAFFALGLIQKHRQPVAITCTSGTSSTNYASAVCEAFYQNLPLVVLTADRLPELLGQKEEQMLKQDSVYDGFIRFRGQLREATDDISLWYNNRVINNAFFNLYSPRCGPVHLNFPIESHHKDTFSTSQLPPARVIRRHDASLLADSWAGLAEELSGKRILIIWGQSLPNSPALHTALTHFSSKLDCAVVADHLGNCHLTEAVKMTYLVLTSLQSHEQDVLTPDVVISFGGNYVFNGAIKNLLRRSPQIKHWDLNPYGEICDPFRNLTRVFEMSAEHFFSRLGEYLQPSPQRAYLEQWKRMEESIEEPAVPFGEIQAIGTLLKRLPSKASLHIANSLPIRIAHLHPLPPTVEVYCNRGVNGIDGCMSAAVGYASGSPELVFLLIGDLTFFYDMNALWNRRLSPNLRILLLNNEGGGVMHMPLKPELASELSKHVSAGHRTIAKGWCDALGIDYHSASAQDDYESLLPGFVAPSNRPALIEVFSKKEDDVRLLRAHLASLKSGDISIKDRLRKKIRRTFFGS